MICPDDGQPCTGDQTLRCLQECSQRAKDEIRRVLAPSRPEPHYHISNEARLAQLTREGVRARKQSDARRQQEAARLAVNSLTAGRPRMTSYNQPRQEVIAALVVLAIIFGTCLAVAWGISVLTGASMWAWGLILFGTFVLIRWVQR